MVFLVSLKGCILPIIYARLDCDCGSISGETVQGAWSTDSFWVCLGIWGSSCWDRKAPICPCLPQGH